MLYNVQLEQLDCATCREVPRLQVHRHRFVDGVEGGATGTHATAAARIEMPAGRTGKPTRAAAANGARGRTLSGSPIVKSAAHPNCDCAGRLPRTQRTRQRVIPYSR